MCSSNFSQNVHTNKLCVAYNKFASSYWLEMKHKDKESKKLNFALFW